MLPVNISEQLRGAQVAAITIEDAAGSPTPTTKPILKAQL